VEIKWYWPAEALGLVTDISLQTNGEYTYQVSARAGDVLFALALSLIPLLFLAGGLLRFFLSRRGRDDSGRTLSRAVTALLLLYALLLAAGIGPYVQFYPHGGGFLDLSLLEHILSGLYTALLALFWFLGGRLGRHLALSCRNRRKNI